MDFLQSIYLKAKKLNKKIVLPETEDPRILAAAEVLAKNKLAKITLVGNPDEINKLAAERGLDLSQAKIINPRQSEYTHDFSEMLYARRKNKGMTPDEAAKIMLNDNVYFGCYLIKAGLADGLVSGSMNPTTHTIQAAVYSVGLAENSSLISSFFVMLLPDTSFGVNGIMFFADCGVVPDPNAEQLAEIAMQTTNSFKKLIDRTPRVAMLSFSTKGSAKHPSLEKVVQATEIVKQKMPKLAVDGELQLDAAIIPAVAKKKARGSNVAGKANILIFPDLTSGNIGYKIAERIGKATAVGPIFQGCAKPINDLSRGCSVDDIVNVSVITCLQVK
ncbi:MAG: phosphate acetyltransferase [Candidatus Margulisbacteria bacterium]|nr:phosphate acetyltransferase [Candidatus Margulisiibacteriota bacterium]MBU1021563.1 phosphate acetyltransferase [Candidatus Margulisiibacteriota bacterium]MBU1728714.1 phosphate acetyltransferase [Candidatus Margulisiibacteriota bacterium]MBU1955165.1 phosphate acetyltransferase [Candidatus Margulisiibacteriota bacterium]